MKSFRHSAGFFRIAAIGLAGVCFGTVSPLQAATKTVDIVDYAFSPSSAAINVNDTIHWVWQSALHSSTAGTLAGASPDAGLWDSGLFNAGHTFDFKFTAAGSYPYYCSYHQFPGSVTVQAVAGAPPSVAITNPANGAVFSAPATISLAATASETNGSVADVEFFNGSTSLGKVSTAPYSVAVPSLAAGDYTVSAVATDGTGQQATNSIIIHVVVPALISFSGPRYSPPGTFQFNYAVSAGLTYIVDRSDTLGVWTPVSTNTPGASPASFQDASASGSAQFYRVRQMPNP